MTDFCYHLGGEETGMPIVKRQLGLAGLDVRAPTTDAIRTLIERLAVVEQDFKGPEEILSNRERRLDWLDRTHSWFATNPRELAGNSSRRHQSAPEARSR